MFSYIICFFPELESSKEKEQLLRQIAKDLHYTKQYISGQLQLLKMNDTNHLNTIVEDMNDYFRWVCKYPEHASLSLNISHIYKQWFGVSSGKSYPRVSYQGHLSFVSSLVLSLVRNSLFGVPYVRCHPLISSSLSRFKQALCFSKGAI